MRLYQKYISSLLIKFFGMTIMTFAFVVILGQFLRLINKYIGKGTNLADMLYMLLLFLPALFIYISPIALFCAIVFTFHKMINDNELVIFETSGISKYNIAKIVIQLALIITIFSYFISIVINPLAKREFHNQKLIIRDGYISGLIEERVFNNLTKGLTIYVDSKNSKGDLNGVFVYDNTKGKNIIITAEEATFIASSNQMSIIMKNGTRQEINPHGQLDILNFENAQLNLLPSQIGEMNHVYSPEEWMITDLIFKTAKDQSMKNIIHTELHQRLSWPLLNLALTSIAVLALSFSNFSRRWSPNTVIYGIIVGAIVIFIHFALESKANHSIIATIMLYINMLAFTGISIFLAKKISEDINIFRKFKISLLRNFEK
jgi:lipopolysaccharide export system permease protein